MTSPHRGVVAGGHPATARAGALALEAGGNAADAAVAAVAASLTAEACLTGLGAGGFALVRRPDGRAELLDFFVVAAGSGRSRDDFERRAHLHPYEVPFRSATQVFNVGPSSCAVPGMPLGLATLHERHGRLPLERVLNPAIQMAHEGITLVPQQDYLHDILSGILTVDSAVRSVFAPAGRLLRHGETLRFPDLGEALEVLAAEGPHPFTHGRYADRISAFMEERGGMITKDDLSSYRVLLRDPVTVRYRDHRILTNPAPSSGGSLIAHTLASLDALDLAPLAPGPLSVALARAMERTDRERPSIVGSSTLGNTTHVSAIDADGMAVSVTSSCGSGSGVVVEGTGIYMNNMMGEEDLNPEGFFTLAPGTRLTSMMAPTIAFAPFERPDVPDSLLALGSAGSERLRSAIVQIIVNIVDLRLPTQEAVDRPRLHHHRGVMHAEGGTPDEVVEALRADGCEVNVWPEKDLFFGGAQVALRLSGDCDLCFEGGGDPRRGGVALIV